MIKIIIYITKLLNMKHLFKNAFQKCLFQKEPYTKKNEFYSISVIPQ